LSDRNSICRLVCHLRVKGMVAIHGNSSACEAIPHGKRDVNARYTPETR
jgi:hypothetical protein